MYFVYNTCGGTIYRGRSLEKAMEATREYFASPYIHSAKGVRPVFDGDDGLSLGEYGEKWDAFRDRNENQ